MALTSSAVGPGLVGPFPEVCRKAILERPVAQAVAASVVVASRLGPRLATMLVAAVARRAAAIRTTGWFGVQKSGYSDVLKGAIRKLNKNSRTLAFEDVFKDMGRKCGYSSLSTRC